MADRIIVLSDGTGNSVAKVWRTNVWRTFDFLDLTGSDQVAKYDDGVGSSSFIPWAIITGAFGWGLKRNVLDLYEFVCRNYKQMTPTKSGSRLFGFGFSRGAFTIRGCDAPNPRARPCTLPYRARFARPCTIGVQSVSRRAIPLRASN